MTYEESATLMNDPALKGRIKVSCLSYAGYIMGEPASTMAHNSRYKWAQAAMIQPDMTAMQIQPMVVMDPAVQLAGAAIEDAALQTAVEGIINKII